MPWALETEKRALGHPRPSRPLRPSGPRALRAPGVLSDFGPHLGPVGPLGPRPTFGLHIKKNGDDFLLFDYKLYVFRKSKSKYPSQGSRRLSPTRFLSS